MYQLTFSNQSINELNKLDKLEQMVLIEKLSSFDLKNKKKNTGKINRNGTTFYRIKAEDYRLYFEIKNEKTLYCHFVLPQHTWTDFAFRCKLPISEDHLIEQEQSFWKDMENLNR